MPPMLRVAQRSAGSVTPTAMGGTAPTGREQEFQSCSAGRQKQSFLERVRLTREILSAPV